jgi:hypothetical protein
MPDTQLPETFTRSDRDTIIRLDTKFDRLSQDIKELKDSVVDRVSRLEEDSADKADLALVKQKADDLLLRKANHEDIVALDIRVNTLESWKDSQKIYLQLTITGITLIFALILWHITGFHF